MDILLLIILLCISVFFFVYHISLKGDGTHLVVVNRLTQNGFRFSRSPTGFEVWMKSANPHEGTIERRVYPK